jgi:hypothetical protein
VDELIEYMDKEGMPQDAKDWYKKVSEEREIRSTFGVGGWRRTNTGGWYGWGQPGDAEEPGELGEMGEMEKLAELV